MGWNGRGGVEAAWDRMGLDGMGWDWTGSNGTGWDRAGLDGMGSGRVGPGRVESDRMKDETKGDQNMVGWDGIEGAHGRKRSKEVPCRH